MIHDPEESVHFADSSVNQIIHHDKSSGEFATLWAQVMFLAHTYNFLAVWYFLGLEGFPSGLWLVAELICEIMSMIDFVLKLCLKHRMPELWRTMWVL